jgi:hypothetical protein
MKQALAYNNIQVILAPIVYNNRDYRPACHRQGIQVKSRKAGFPLPVFTGTNFAGRTFFLKSTLKDFQ